MHGIKGHVDTGYSCMMPAMIAQWRKFWSVEPHTTPSDAPFGLVVLPASGGEGGANMGAMRLAQTGSFGVLPNAAMPNTFMAQVGLRPPLPACLPCTGVLRGHTGLAVTDTIGEILTASGCCCCCCCCCCAAAAAFAFAFAR